MDMSAWSFLPMGLMLGMLHALEPDHIAAVTAMFQDKKGKRSLISRALFWAMGHGLALLIICSIAVGLGVHISDRFTQSGEALIGLIIVGLGIQVLWRLRKNKVHAHVHEHGGNKHIHFHQHEPKIIHSDATAHEHSHKVWSMPSAKNIKAMVIGLVHGTAGSGGVMVLIMASTQSYLHSLEYLICFAIGTLAGMGLISVALSWPLALALNSAFWVRQIAIAMIGTCAILIGGNHMLASFMNMAVQI